LTCPHDASQPVARAAGDVDAAVGQALDGALLPRARPGRLAEPPPGLPRALACLGAVAAALAMRAHPRTQARLSAPAPPPTRPARSPSRIAPLGRCCCCPR